MGADHRRRGRRRMAVWVWMDPLITAVALLGGLVLGGLWLVHLRRDVSRRRARSSEWDGDDSDAEQLWTSQARCLACRARGALLTRESGQLWHTCMACGDRHVRSHRG